MTAARGWLARHPTLARVYMPLVVSLTFVVSIADALKDGCR